MDKRELLDTSMLEALAELRQEGQEWPQISDVSQRINAKDQEYRARREAVNRMLGRAGIKREDQLGPYARIGRLYPAAGRLRKQELVKYKVVNGSKKDDQTRLLLHLVEQPGGLDTPIQAQPTQERIA